MTHTASEIVRWTLIAGMAGILVFLGIWAASGKMEKAARATQWVLVSAVSIAWFVLLCCGPLWLAAKVLSRLEPLGSLILIGYLFGWFHVPYAIAWYYMETFNCETGFRRWIHAFVDGAVIPPWFMLVNWDDEDDSDVYFLSLYKDWPSNIFYEDRQDREKED